MDVFSREYITQFQQKVWDFYHAKGRHHLSFRQTKQPYHIHISEIMLSQTQVARVEQYFNNWITTFPDIKSVVNASKTEVLQAWQGLGYNSRVLNFQIACAQLLKEFDGEYPQDDTKLQTLKGVGPYVSSAILAFAFNINVGVVDTNIRRILIYYKFIDDATPAKKIQTIAKMLTPKGKAREWNNALMDFGALHLTVQKTEISSLGKQGKFIGSTRYIRSFIVKECLKNGNCPLSFVEKECEKYQHNADKIIVKLVAEKVIHRQGNMLSICP